MFFPLNTSTSFARICFPLKMVGRSFTIRRRDNLLTTIISRNPSSTTASGDITKFDLSLNAINTTKFKFAHYSVATAFGGKVYALDQQGSLIVLNGDLSKSKIYDVGSVDKPAFISGTKLYKDGDMIELSQLGYE